MNKKKITSRIILITLIGTLALPYSFQLTRVLHVSNLPIIFQNDFLGGGLGNSLEIEINDKNNHHFGGSSGNDLKMIYVTTTGTGKCRDAYIPRDINLDTRMNGEGTFTFSGQKQNGQLGDYCFELKIPINGTHPEDAEIKPETPFEMRISFTDYDPKEQVGYGYSIITGSFTLSFKRAQKPVSLSIVKAIADEDAVALPSQRKAFYANGRFWVFYGDFSYELAYSTSTDGLSWSSSFIRGCEEGHFFSIWFDETYLHYACVSSDGRTIVYRKGKPNANGTIAWCGDEQIVVSDTEFWAPSIIVDSEGYPWIGYSLSNGSVCITRSSKNDGIWETSPGFPICLPCKGKFGEFTVSLVPLTSGKILAVYGGLNTPVYFMAWDGVKWLTPVNTTRMMRG